MEKELKYYYQTNWETTNEEKEPFESALSSMVSSPSTQVMIGGGYNNDHGMMMELIGRLGCISDSNITNTTTTNTTNNSSNISCYTTPLNSPPYNKVSTNTSHMLITSVDGGGVNLPNCHPPAGLLPLDADPDFVERAARFSSFGGGGGGGSGVNLECGKFGKVSSSTPENGDNVGDSRQGSSVSDQNPVAQMGLIHLHSTKRKSFSNSIVQHFEDNNKLEQENEKANAKRSKANGEEVKIQNGGECNAITTTNSNSNNNKKEKQNNSKEVAKAEPPKDYIHVRARRGQATDSHSLAERVRREKISERMKFLQDLVPGCNKVTGKAIVLDEIINYVQSLQRQVEFLSMKLTTFNPSTEFNPESLMSKDVFQTKGLSTMPQIMYHLEQNYAQAFPHGYQPFQQMHSHLPNVAPNGNENPFSSNPSNVAGIRRHLTAQLPSSITQMPNFWEDDLQSIVQLGIIQNQTQSVPGTSTNAQMKVEQ